MGMVVRTNTMAMNANRQLGMNNNAVSKSLEKLSSGFRINRAADDASGLAISEKMKAQIKGLEQASSNSQDGISLIQTAEGATTEIHNMLNRMVELATKSANGTIQNEVDREAIQQEVDDLNTEITRIAKSTNFNGINLLDGSLSAKVSGDTTVDTGATQFRVPTGDTLGFGGTKVDATAARHDFALANIKGADATLDAYKITYKDAEGNQKSFTVVESALAGVGETTASLATALNGGGGLALATADDESAANFKEFQELFTASSINAAGAAGDTLAIQAKEAGLGDLVSVEKATNAVPGTAITNLASVAEAATSKKAEVAGYEMTLGTANPTAGDSFTINGKTYEYVAAAGDPTADGATGIVLGAGGSAQQDTAKNVVEQLKKDGFEVKVSNTDDTKVLFTKPEQLTEAQKGAQISASSDNVVVNKQESAKGSADITVGAGGGTNTQTLTFKYTDADGNMQTKTLSYTADTTQATNATNIYDALKADSELSSLFDFDNTTANHVKVTAKSKGTGVAQFAGIASNDGTATFNANITEARDTGKSLTLTNQATAGDTITVNGKTYEFVDDASVAAKEGNTAVVMGATKNETMENLAKQLKADNIAVNHDKANGTLYFSDQKNNITTTEKSGGLTLQIGDTNDDFNKVTVSVDDLTAEGIGTAGLDVSNQDAAGDSIATIKAAINKVSTNRANLGSLQNRLEYTINNLDTTAENMTSANSRIRDTDMAKEMMNYTKMNVLTQAAQAMLAQANQQPQSILQLLQ